MAFFLHLLLHGAASYSFKDLHYIAGTAKYETYAYRSLLMQMLWNIF